MGALCNTEQKAESGSGGEGKEGCGQGTKVDRKRTAINRSQTMALDNGWFYPVLETRTRVLRLDGGVSKVKQVSGVDPALHICLHSSGETRRT